MLYVGNKDLLSFVIVFSFRRDKKGIVKVSDQRQHVKACKKIRMRNVENVLQPFLKNVRPIEIIHER